MRPARESVRSFPPDSLERFRQYRGVTHHVGDAGVATEMLQARSIHALAGQSVARHLQVFLLLGNFTRP